MSAAPSTTLSTPATVCIVSWMISKHYQERLEQGKCVWSRGCKRPLADGSSLCERHLSRSKRKTREWVAEKRAKRREDGVCIFCPGSNPTPVTPPDTYCMACRIRRKRLVKVDGTRLQVNEGDRAAKLAAATRRGEDGRTRYHGQQKRGNQPAIQLDDQDIRYIKDAVEAGHAGIHAYEAAKEAKAPVFQREDIKSAALHQLSRASGHIDDILARRGFFKEKPGHTIRKHGKRDGE